MINKVFATTLIALSLSACQTSQHLQSSASQGVASNFSCGQINNAFSAYQGDKQSFDALLELAKMTHLDTSRITTATADDYYDQAKQSASLALILQGCQPLI